VIFGQSARTRWDILLHGSILNRFLAEVKDAAVQVIPAEKKPQREKPQREKREKP
jgi:two-component system sensor histidine kinase KdpD